MKFSFPEADVERLRDSQEDFMADQIRIERRTEPFFDDETLIEHKGGEGEQIYEGKCRIAPAIGSSREVVGEELVSWKDAEFYIPHGTPEIRLDDLITIIESEDSEVVGRVFRVTDVRYGTYQASRRLSAVALMPSRTTEDQV